jgi:hypothetical protein
MEMSLYNLAEMFFGRKKLVQSISKGTKLNCHVWKKQR